MATSFGWGCLFLALGVAAVAVLARLLAGPLPGLLGRALWSLASLLVFAGSGTLWLAGSLVG